MLDLQRIESEVRKHYENAKDQIIKLAEYKSYNSVVSDRIPGYKANRLKFGDYIKDNFSVLFIDMRHSTKRAKTIGPEKTFTSMHAFIPAMLEVINHHKGYVIDIMGDGIMVFFGGKESEMTKAEAAQVAGLCGRDMLMVLKKVVNKILNEDKIYNITCGVGVDYGDVIVTKIGIDSVYDVKAFGDCINTASKYADSISDGVIVSEKVKELWPSSKGGKIKFSLHKSNGYLLYKQEA